MPPLTRACTRARPAFGSVGGFTYLGVLFLILLLLMSAAAAGAVWQVVAQREREAELLFVGEQYRQAIEQFHKRSPSGVPQFPRQLSELLSDRRVLTLQRDLRRAYRDPFDRATDIGSAAWGLIRAVDGGIVGVHSFSNAVPIKRSGFAPGLAFEAARSHRDWRFIAPSAVGLALAAPESQGPDVAPIAAEPPSTPAPAPAPAPDPQEPAPAAEAPALPRAPRQVDYRSRTPDACQRIAVYDHGLCAQQAAAFGPQAGRDCQDSATVREGICPFTDQVLPPLYLRFK